MDPKETSFYHIYLITAVVITGLALYFIFSAIFLNVKFRRSYHARLEAEINKLESEKKKIAQDLHDEISPVLTAIKMKLSSLSVQSSADTEAVGKSIGYINILTEKMRNISTGLIPSVLQDKGLVISIEQHLHNLGNDCDIEIEFSSDTLPDLPFKRALHIFRIVQEIVHNTCKHASASRLEISITIENNLLILATADDGQGFRYNSSPHFKQGYGLSNIHNRVYALNGTLNIDTAPLKGTRFYMELPVS
jgi:two-component system, NarL family, sensor kinase